LSGTALEFPVEGLSDGEVRVRLPADADVRSLVEICQDPAIQRFTTVPDPYGGGDARHFLDMCAAGVRDGLAVHAVVVDADYGEILGTVGIRRHATDEGRWDIGYLVAAPARGRGVATRAVRLISRFGFAELGAERIEISVEPANEPSQRVAERAGFQREGLLRGYQVVKGVRRDMLMYSLLRGELRS
jgi:[ribosomal protein S5]-alanine N-acetyltransferase